MLPQMKCSGLDANRKGTRWHLLTKDCGLDLSLGQFWSDKAVVTVQSGLCQLGRGLSVMLRGELVSLSVKVGGDRCTPRENLDKAKGLR